MVRVKVKICGITNLDDALAAVDMGADVLGFNFYPESPRYVDVDKFHEIATKLPTFVDIAGVFVNADIVEIRRVVNVGYLNWVQVHGDESVEYCEQLKGINARSIKAVRVRTAMDIMKAMQYSTDAVLFDAYNPKAYGGTGERFDWGLLSNVPRRVFLAGGINPGNALAAVDQGTYGIDVCSGIESEPGKKDHALMKELFDSIKYFVK